MLPTLTAITPSAALVTNTMTTFTVESSGVPTSWTWTFGDGATPSSANGAQPVVQLGTPGRYTGSVIACNAAGCSDPFIFGYRVQGTAPVPEPGAIT
ncbi:MAG: PKD domain-containing protein, partial [bacterium]